MALAVLIALTLVAVFWRSRVGEIFCVSVRDGKPLVVRGRVPPRLLDEFRDVLGDPPVARGKVRAVKSAQGARLVASGGIDAARAQRLRNVFGMYPPSVLRSAPALPRRTIGQVLGIAWLAWLFERRGGR